MLDAPPAIVSNWSGDLVVQPGSDVRRLSTYGDCELDDLLTGRVLESGGSYTLNRWWWPEPSERASAFIVRASGYVRVTVRERYDYEHVGDWRYGLETINWAGPADFNVDGRVDLFDFLAFQTAWFEGSLSADFDRDGRLSIFDFLAFGNTFPTPGATRLPEGHGGSHE